MKVLSVLWITLEKSKQMTKILLSVFKFIMNFIYCFFKLFKTTNQVTFISRQSNDISLDFMLLSEQFKKDHPDYKVVVLCKKSDNFSYVFHMFRQMYEIARSKCVVLDTYCINISILKHKKGLIVVQIWHAIGMMKKAGYATVGKKDGRSMSLSQGLNMHQNYTNVFTSSNACIDGMSQVFNCDPNIIESAPLPRVDFLRSDKNKEYYQELIFNKYPQLKDKLNVLYVPTFRKDEESMKLEVEKFISTFDYDHFNLLVKMHPLSKIELNNDKIFNIRDFNSQQLLFIADYVISDYSSIVFEAGVMGKKIIYFAFDLDMYKDDRDFFIDYVKEVSGPICKDGFSVNEALKNYQDNNVSFISTYVDDTIDNCTKYMSDRLYKLVNGGV
ncbi:MAG: CDP-glycerol glycerophosphotransferase family protein [Erysipelotrichaceae bacterium]